MRHLAFVLALPAVVACSATASSKFKGGSSGAGGDATSITVAATGVGGADLSTTSVGVSTGSGSEGCSEAATYVYVLSTDNALWSFQPDKKLFTKIGNLGCNTAMQPNSMAVDRDATAWVNYVQPDQFGLGDAAGMLFPVSTTDASCKGAGAPLPNGWFRLGMGFSTNGGQSDSETLYVSGTTGGVGLASFDLGSKQLKPVGTFSGGLAGYGAELTGTGDGRLFGFFTSIPVEVAELDKQTAKIVKTKSLPEVPTPSAWAFSFWGGDFYLYTSDGLSNSRVSRYRPSDDTVDPNYMTDVGFIIVGAGVSTCAPVEPPK